MTEPAAFHLLQVCPHDIAPFRALCDAYRLSAAQKGGVVHTFFLSSPTDEPDPHAHYLHLKRLNRSGRTQRALLRAVRQLQTREQIEAFDALICHRYRGFRATRRLAIPDPLTIVVAHEFGMFERLGRRLYRQWFAKDVHFAGVSPAVCDELAAITGFGMVLPNTIDVAQYDAQRLSRAEARDRLGLPQDGPLIGVVGRIHYKKRPELALQAFQTLTAREINAELVYLGSGDPDAVAALQQPGVHLPGAVAEGHRYFNAFDVLLHTGNVESFGMVVLEGMLAGLPCVAAGKGPEYVLGGTGFVPEEDTPVAYADALQRALNADPDVARKMRERVIQRFSVDAFASQLEGTLRFLHQPNTEFDRSDKDASL